MAHANPLNVYKGKDGLRKYFDPDAQPPLPLVELPDKLNPFCKDKVRIYAKMLTILPAQNVKALPGECVRLVATRLAKSRASRLTHGNKLSTCSSMTLPLLGSLSLKRVLDRPVHHCPCQRESCMITMTLRRSSATRRR